LNDPQTKESLNKVITKKASGRPRKIKYDIYGQGELPFRKEGGILKALDGLRIQGLKYDNKKGALPYATNIVPNNEWIQDNKPTPKFLNEINNTTEQQFNMIKPDLNKYLNKGGFNYSVDTYDDFIAQLKDGKFGPVQNYYTNMLSQMNKPIQGIKTSQIAIDPIKKGDINKAFSTGNIEKPITGQGVLPTIGKVLGNIDATDLSNLAMYANTFGTNKRIGDEQRKAVSDSMYTLPYMQQTYIRADKPYSIQTDKQVAEFESKAGRIANATSDINKGMGVRLGAQTQVNAMRDKSNMADQQRTDQMKSQQTQANINVNKINTDILGKNRGLAAGAFKQTHLINANQDLSQNTALNNLVLAINKNIPVKEYKRNLGELYKYANDTKMKSAYDIYSKTNDDTNTEYGLAKYQVLYDKYKKDNVGKTILPWEKSTYYDDWVTAKKNSETQYNIAMKPYQQATMRMQYQLPLLYGSDYQQPHFLSFARGGLLSKSDQIEIDDNRNEHTRKQKEAEMIFKAILHNDEMLIKSLIRVFK
jgi:hypothetical protein